MSISLRLEAIDYQPRVRQAVHYHDALHLSLVLRGSIEETVGNVTERAGPLSVVVKEAGVAHANDFGRAGAKLVRLQVASDTIGSLIGDKSRSPEWKWTHDVRVAAPFLRLAHRATEGSSTFDSSDPDVLDLFAAVTARPALAPRGRPPAWLEERVRELRETWYPGLTVRNIAERAGVHPVYLARSFRRWYGSGVAEEMRRLRFRQAVAQIAHSTRTISRVAHEAGFADEPHLCREFRRTVGFTPRRYRTLIKGLDS
jgi:AraC family transcriptional regulator